MKNYNDDGSLYEYIEQNNLEQKNLEQNNLEQNNIPNCLTFSEKNIRAILLEHVKEVDTALKNHIDCINQKFDEKSSEHYARIVEFFEKQDEQALGFYEKIMKWNINERKKFLEETSEKMNNINSELQETLRLNKQISGELLKELQYFSIETFGDKENNIIYENVKKGIIQYSIQSLVTVGIVLLIFGAYAVIKFLIKF